MSEDPDGSDERADRRPSLASTDPVRSIDLESMVVRYERRPDRCTVVPRECSEAKRATTWLSADLGAFVDLEEMR